MAFRKLDVDSIEEGAFAESDFLPPGVVPAYTPAEAQSIADACSGEVRSLVQRGNYSAALTRALESPIYGNGLDEAKATAAKTVLDVLFSTKVADVPKIIEALNTEQRELLMKYIYRGFAHPENVNCSVLLTWHEKLTEVAGQGSIVRVITDRRTV
ncbi:actin-related protein ARPC5 [Thamnocephalis sphaerospora]|uniref:Actin-related protein 2/3 complex subunit 5 n=1 Tax=Thamnocephalis sphaerospora TaxID=78915 RepID=A0A4P9XTM7_9FUNG|nr:actin-related protein ARPC5 [Thamnocephalis sphaerospora]|eukprot:RKP09506.1 actin-related protein ARPC5 [Thamnocephalis sphaerospora]